MATKTKSSKGKAVKASAKKAAPKKAAPKKAAAKTLLLPLLALAAFSAILGLAAAWLRSGAAAARSAAETPPERGAGLRWRPLPKAEAG